LPQLDHMILNVNDRQKSIEFYTQVLGFAYDGERDPFSQIKVGTDQMLLLAPFGTKGGEHLAFRLTPGEFEETFRRIRERGLEYGDKFNQVGNMRGPGTADGAKGDWKAVYLFDPDRHLIEIGQY